MLELTGLTAIAAVLIGSTLLALLAGEALIGGIIRAMNVGVKRADGQRTAARPRAGFSPGLQAVSRFSRVGSSQTLS